MDQGQAGLNGCMTVPTDMPSKSQPQPVAFRGIYPPSFCHLPVILAVAVVTQLSVLLIAVGALQFLGWRWLLMATAYAHALALFCVFSLCVCRAWIQRLSQRDAWALAWGIVIMATLAFSYVTGVMGTVLGIGPGQQRLAPFMLHSLLAASLVAVAFFRYLFIRAQWQAQVLEQAEAQVQALQSRIRPHFLFNSLNTIASLIPDDPEGAERTTEDLADLFRGSMQQVDRLISLQDELELARKYLNMEQRRLGDRLCVDWRVDALPPGASVLPLILQPLLENAVTHGIQPRTDGGELKVYGREEDDRIVITITNPLSPGQSKPGHGMALDNIQARLELAFGGVASLVTSQDGECFYAVLSLPHVKNPDR